MAEALQLGGGGRLKVVKNIERDALLKPKKKIGVELSGGESVGETVAGGGQGRGAAGRKEGEKKTKMNWYLGGDRAILPYLRKRMKFLA